MATLILLLSHAACRQISVGLYLIKYTLMLFGLIIPMKTEYNKNYYECYDDFNCLKISVG